MMEDLLSAVTAPRFVREALIVLGINVLYACLCWIPALDTTQYQRAALAKIRRRIALVLGSTKKITYAPDAVENGPSWRYQPALFITMITLQTPGHLYEGHHAPVFVLIGMAMCLLHATTMGNFQQVQSVGRWCFMASLAIALLMYRMNPVHLQSTILLRVIRTRTFSCLTLTERLDEAFFQFAVLSLVAYAYFDGLAVLPIYVLLLCIVPVHMLGLREWLASLHSLGDNFFTKNKAEVFAALLPVLTFILESPREVTPVNAISFTFMFSCAAGLFFLFRRRIDKFLMGLTLEEDRQTKTIRALLKDYMTLPWTRNELLDLVMQTLTTHGACSLNVVSFVTLLAAIDLPVFWIVVGAIAMTFPLVYLDILAEQRIVSFAYQVFLLVCMRMTGEGNHLNIELPFVLAMASRAFKSIMNRNSFALPQAEAMLIFALATLWFGTTLLFRFVFSLSMITFGVSLMITLARERPREILKREHDADSFLAHQLKQKYCAVSSVVEQCLERMESQISSNAIEDKVILNGKQTNNEVLANALDPIRHYLNLCLRECSKGHEECHAVNVVRNLRRRGFSRSFGQHPCKEFSHPAKSEVLSWVSRGLIEENLLLLDPRLPDDVVLTTHWEGLKAFILMFTARHAHVVIRYDEEHRMLVFTFLSKRRMSTEDITSLVGVVRMLRGTLLNEEFGFALECFRQTKLEAQRASEEENDELLKARGLRVAVLDDSEIIRKHVQKTLEAYGIASKASSIYKGATPEECLEFPAEVIKLDCFDLVIMDENLCDGISGSELGSRMRNMGYSGCLLLHSAMSDSAVQESNIFDGYVDKSTSRKDFVRSVTRAFILYLDKKQLKKD